jgi:hypothetical protein
MVPAANVGDVNTTMNTAQHRLGGQAVHIAQWPCKKAISLYDDVPEHLTVVVRFDVIRRFRCLGGSARQSSGRWHGVKPPATWVGR